MFHLSDPARRVARVVALVLGAALLAGAVVIALRHVDLDRLAEAHPWQWLLLACGVVANIALAAGVFWAVTLSFDAVPPVSYARMWQLIAASALVNFLPFQPGLLARATFLKLRHQLPLRQSGVILILVMVLTLAVAAGAVLIARQPPPGGTAAAVALAAVLLAAALTGPIVSAVVRRPVRLGWAWVPIKTLDLLVSGLRLYIALLVVGGPLTYSQALVIAAAGAVVSMLAPTPNGLGFKEWAIAAAAGAMTGPSADLALAASLVDRGVEALVTTPLGLAAIFALRRLHEPDCHAPRL